MLDDLRRTGDKGGGSSFFSPWGDPFAFLNTGWGDITPPRLSGPSPLDSLAPPPSLPDYAVQPTQGEPRPESATTGSISSTAGWTWLLWLLLALLLLRYLVR